MLFISMQVSLRATVNTVIAGLERKLNPYWLFINHVLMIDTDSTEKECIFLEFA